MLIFPAIDLYGGKAVRLYKGDYQDVNITQETLDAFHAMVKAFHEAQKSDVSYKVGGF